MMQREMHTLESIETVCNEVGTYIKQSTTFKEQIHEQQITTIDVGSDSFNKVLQACSLFSNSFGTHFGSLLLPNLFNGTPQKLVYIKYITSYIIYLIYNYNYNYNEQWVSPWMELCVLPGHMFSLL